MMLPGETSDRPEASGKAYTEEGDRAITVHLAANGVVKCAAVLIYGGRLSSWQHIARESVHA